MEDPHGPTGARPGRLGALVPWVPVLVGIGILAGYMIYAIVLTTAGPDAPDPPRPPARAQQPPSLPVPSATATPPVAEDEPPPDYGVDPAQNPPTTPPASEAPTPDVVGEYRLVDTFGDGFIGKVVLANTADRARDWTVELAFGPDVGRLREFWVDGTVQPTVTRSGDRYVFTSSAPVDAGSWLKLKLHFDRDGWDITPTVCTVNDAACEVRD